MGAETFWAWFRARCDAIASSYNQLDHLEMSDEISAHVQALGLGWEIGPAPAGGLYFAISPNGDASGLPLASSIVARAPKHTGWELVVGRQPKTWNWKVRLSGVESPIDASSWRYVLYGFDDGMYEIEFIADTLHGIAEPHRSRAAGIVLDSVGEALTLALIDRFTIVEPPGPDEPPRESISILNLFDHLSSLRAGIA